MDYETQDIILAACLKLNGYELDRIEKIGNRGTFFFNNVDNEFLQQFDLDKIRVKPIAFNNMIKQLTTTVRRMVTS